MTDFPRSLIEFQRRFAGERACAESLLRARWSDGVRFPPAVARMPTTRNRRIKREPTE